MARLSRSALLVFLAAVVGGVCLHFLYARLPNPATALFSPVSESLWEHVKLLYWPGLAASLLLARRGEPGSLAIRCFTLLLSAGLMLLIGYLYHVSLGGRALWFDIALYVLLMALALLLPSALSPSRWSRHAPLLALLTAALGIFILLFTFLPPASVLFADLSRANTWSVLPC